MDNNLISIETPIGFADSHIIRMESFNDELIVLVKAWDETILEVSFAGVIGLRESMVYELSDFVVSTDIGEFGEWCRTRAYNGNCSNGERSFRFLDVDYAIAVEVIAKEFHIRIR